MDGVVLGAGEGEALFGGRIVIKASFGELCITESLFPDARPGAGTVQSYHIRRDKGGATTKDERRKTKDERRMRWALVIRH